MKTVCCSNMPFAKEAFSTLGETVLKDGRLITAADVRDADILATRSTTQVNASLLDGSKVKFVGTATIGTDHLDIAYLESKGIRWTYAPGCNANSVSEYFCAALLRLATRHGFSLSGRTLGIVGVGNVGSRVAQKAPALGLNVLLNDPPRQRAQAAGKDPGTERFVGLDEIIDRSDIITFHVPLTKEGMDATWHMADAGFFSRLKDGCIFVNAARGGTTDTDALVSAVKGGKLSYTVLDTWEGEPGIRKDILELADIATPHIAGHSYEGKVMGTVMVYREACRFLGKDPGWDYESLLPEPLVPEVSVDCAGRTDEEILNEVITAVYDIEEDDRSLRAAEGDMAKHFDRLRKEYRIRREFRFTEVITSSASAALLTKLKTLGFRVWNADCGKCSPASHQ